MQRKKQPKHNEFYNTKLNTFQQMSLEHASNETSFESAEEFPATPHISKGPHRQAGKGAGRGKQVSQVGYY